MKKYVIYEIAIVLITVLSLTGMGYAGMYDSDSKSNPESSQPGMTDQDRTIPQAEQITLSGTIDTNSQLVDENGQTFELSDTGEGRALKSMIGKKVEVTGTVMEEAGQRIVEVQDYKVLEEE